MTAASLVELRDLKVERGGVPVLDISSFRLHEHEFVSLVGPNGSGKSTLLLSVMCLLRRVAGQVLYRGSEIGDGRTALAFRRKIAMVLQDPLLFDATVHDNVASGLKIRGLGRDERRRRVATYLERFNLTHMAQRSARKLSGGEARRVSLARALAVEPDMIFLDEPFTSLDPPTRQSITEDLNRTIRETGMAAILVTHDQSESLRLSDRIVVMNAGRIVQAESPSVIMDRPANEFVAGWVGMESILEGVVRESVEGRLRVRVDEREIEAIGKERPGDRVHLCIRPENVVVNVADPAGKSSARNVFAGKIVSVSSMGPFLKLTLDCGFRLVSYVTAESFASLGLSKRGEVFASFKATAIHVMPSNGASSSSSGLSPPP